MPRSVKEWVGKSDDSAPSAKCKLRILERQGWKDAITGQQMRDGDVIEYDHITPLWLGGENRESNLQAILSKTHKRKTATEATVRAKVDRVQKKRAGIKKPSRGFQKPKGAKFDWSKGRYVMERD